MILKMMLIVVGIFLLILDLFMYARQKLTDRTWLGDCFCDISCIWHCGKYGCSHIPVEWSKKCGTVCICCVCCYNPVFI